MTGPARQFGERAAMKFSLDGVCNRCGLCCVDREAGARCEHLEINDSVGAPMATRCKVYGERYNGMPITMIDAHGEVVGETKCFKDTVDEAISIIKAGIGRGCSLMISGLSR